MWNKQFDNFSDYSIHFRGLFSNNLASASMDEYGNVLIDNGSMSGGRLSCRITDVELSIEERPEEPGCADVCPPRVIIHFDCKKGGKCITDPGLDIKSHSGVLVYSVEHGKKAFDFLKDFQRFVLENN